MSQPTPPLPKAMTGWHSMAPAEAIAGVAGHIKGLSGSEAAERLARYGANTLPDAPAVSLLQRLLAQLDNLFIYVLLASAVLAALLGEHVDAGVILGVVVLNAIVGVVQEGRAEQALAAIRGMVETHATVLRDGRRTSIAAAEVVPGDIVVLAPGDRVPADLRLTEARALAIDESALTGESVPVSKSLAAVPHDRPLAERSSMAYAGTLATSGHGAGIVVATGRATELGGIGELMRHVTVIETPLTRQMNAFARQLTLAILVVSAATFLVAVLLRGYPFAEAFMAMVGMAVAAIPEGLPAVMTITLAIGVERMARRHAIIRRLPAVETLGAVSTICSDKTGTLTRNEMTATDIVLAAGRVRVTGTGYALDGTFTDDGDGPLDAGARAAVAQLARNALLSSDATLVETAGRFAVAGDPMEGALVALAGKVGLDRKATEAAMPRVDVIPFDAAHRYMATLHANDGTGTLACVKGAPEAVLHRCALELTGSGPVVIDGARWHSAVADLARHGRRVIAVAERRFDDGRRDIDHADIAHGLTLIGLVGLIDPPRPEAVSAIAECRNAGIAVKMITGDHAVTAGAIASELGLDHADRPVTGETIGDLDHRTLEELVATTGVFARTSPEHKLRLVAALQADGAVVAMTGDGVNDAPALKRADVGVAMGLKGTDAAKSAADIVLADDNFASIVAAVREGRTVRDNLTKVIAWTLPTSGGEMLLIAAAILFGLTLPVTPVQVLWINMVTAVGLGLVLAFEPAEPTIMERPPRSASAPILSPFLVWRTAFVAVLFAIIAFAMFAWARARGLGLDEARTIVVNTVVVLEIFYLFAIRYLRGPSITVAGIVGTPAVLIGVGATTAAQFAFTYWPPLQALFRTAPVALADGLAIVGTGILLLAILEVEKLVARRIGLDIGAST
ncbi:MAG: HAD-IC family P-type ATPase [Hyphomicrobiaceae bacterium]